MLRNIMPHCVQSVPARRGIDRLRWSAGFCFTSYGRRVGIRCNDAEVLEQLAPLLPPDWTPSVEPLVDCVFSLWLRRSGKSRKNHCFYKNGQLVGLGANVDSLLERFESELQLEVAEHARDRVFIHAGVVGWKGRALVLPGRSMAGKSTLVEALVRLGATYYSDEYAVLDGNGQVHPYLRRLSLRQRLGERSRPAQRCTAGDLGGVNGVGPLPVRLVAVTKYEQGASWTPKALTTGQTVFELINNTLPTLTYPERVLTAIQQVAPRARALKGRRGEAEETASALLRELEPDFSF